MSLELQIDRLWASPLAEAAMQRFEREWTDDIVRRRTPAPGPDRQRAYWALKEDFKDAWGRKDLKSVAGLGLVLHRARVINDGYREHLAEALLAQDRFAEAREVLAASAQDDHGHWFLLAWALAGLEAFGEARNAVRRAADRLQPIPEASVDLVLRAIDRRHRLDLAFGSQQAGHDGREHRGARRPDLAAARLSAFFARRLELFDALLGLLAGSSRDWDTLREEVSGLLVLGLYDRAADRLCAALVEARPTASDQVQTALRLATAAAAAATGDRPAALLRAVRLLFAAGPDADFIDQACAVIEGEAPWTPLTAAEPWAQDRVQMLAATVLARAGRVEPAIALFGRFVLDHPDRWAVRCELVICCGQESLGRIRLEPRPRAGPPRIIDIFPYNGELEVLKVKLHEMGPWVDHFVIYEANQTYTGLPKPIFLPEQSAEIAEFLPKIIHLVTSDPPAHVTTAWAREYHQRDDSVTALQGLCAPDDLVLLTDTDEIVDHRRLEGFEGDFAVLKKAQHRYFFNYRRMDTPWSLSGNLILMRARHLKDFSYSVARTLLPAQLGPNRLEGAGWHFSSIGDVPAIVRKLASYSHEENVRTHGRDRLTGLLERIRAGDLEPGWERCDLDELPAYIADNRERLAHLIL